MTNDREPRRLLVVSHPAVLPVNQHIYAQLSRRGWIIRLFVPNRWRHEFGLGVIRPSPLETLRSGFTPLPILFPGLPQRHLYLANILRSVRTFKPDVAFLEQEPFSFAAAQWGLACHMCHVPFGVQAAENMAKRLPAPIRLSRSLVLNKAAYVAARSPAAQRLVRGKGRNRVEIIPHQIPPWKPVTKSTRRHLTVGFAGRLVPEKGLATLVQAMRLIDRPLELLVVGDGPLRAWLQEADLGRSRLRLITGADHNDMPTMYAEMDLLVLPSRTTPRWTEQFGRVLVEALWSGVPVVGSSSGEIPWVLEVTQGGKLFPEDNASRLAETIEELLRDPKLREFLGTVGKRRAEERFGLETVTDCFENLLLESCTDGRRS